MLEHLLLDVGNFSEQLVYQLDKETQERLIERYYGLDDAFCREVVGKKLRKEHVMFFPRLLNINNKLCHQPIWKVLGFWRENVGTGVMDMVFAESSQFGRSEPSLASKYTPLPPFSCQKPSKLARFTSIYAFFLASLFRPVGSSSYLVCTLMYCMSITSSLSCDATFAVCFWAG